MRDRGRISACWSRRKRPFIWAERCDRWISSHCKTKSPWASLAPSSRLCATLSYSRWRRRQALGPIPESFVACRTLGRRRVILLAATCRQ